MSTENHQALTEGVGETGVGLGEDRWTSRLSGTLWPPFWIVSPTWGLANVLKPRRDRFARAKRIRQLNHLYFWSSISLVAAAVVFSGDKADTIRPDGIRWWAVLIQYLLLSRFFEIGGAFLRDAFDKLQEPEPSSALGWGERVVLAMRSYVELTLDFAMIYALLPASAWVQTTTPLPPFRITDMVWYSANVVTTSGGGGYYPASFPLKLLTIGEVLCGVILLVVSFTIYTTRALGGVPQPRSGQDGGGKLNATKADVIKFLRRRSALIVHFASAPQLVGTGLRHPASLLGVIGDPSIELSSSVVQPGDGFGMGAIPRNATGMIGLILSPRSDTSVIAVDALDAGSFVLKGRRHFTPRSFDVHALEESMTARGQATGPGAAYNEWGMRDYGIIGLFVADCTANEVMYAGAVGHDYEPVADTIAHFRQAPLRVFTFQASGIVELVGGNVRPVQHAELYA